MYCICILILMCTYARQKNGCRIEMTGSIEKIRYVETFFIYVYFCCLNMFDAVIVTFSFQFCCGWIRHLVPPKKRKIVC